VRPLDAPAAPFRELRERRAGVPGGRRMIPPAASGAVSIGAAPSFPNGQHWPVPRCLPEPGSDSKSQMSAGGAGSGLGRAVGQDKRVAPRPPKSLSAHRFSSATRLCLAPSPAKPLIARDALGAVLPPRLHGISSRERAATRGGDGDEIR
jgi:hypothetical protein